MLANLFSGLFRIQSHGAGLVKLKSLKTMKYIAISSTGQIYSTVRLTRLEMFAKKVMFVHLSRVQ